MAKGKHAAALFEVIHRDVRYAPVRRRGSAVKWLREHLPHLPSRHAAATGGNAAVGVADVEADPTLRPHPMLLNTPPSAPAVPASQGLGMTQLEPGDHLLAAPSARPAAAASTPPAPPVRVDRERQVIKIRLTYTSAAVTGFAVLVAVVLAFILGRGGPATPDNPLNSASTEEIRAGAVTPGVLDVMSEAGGAPARAADAPEAPRTASKPLPPPPTPTTLGDRIVGMNYVIVQSYPEEKDAQAAVEVLRQHGISATVVKGTAYAPRWYSVVGLEPFDHLSGNAEYRQYVKRITEISNKFAGNSKFKKFEPRPYKWQNH